jgi:hypothetical protein
MSETGRAASSKGRQQPSAVAQRDPQQSSGICGGDLRFSHSGQDHHTSLLFLGQRDRLPGHEARVTDLLFL